MRARSCSLWLLLCMGCQTLGPIDAQELTSPAQSLWEEGQAAMRQRKTTEAIACYEKCLNADPRFSRAHLSLAAAHLESGAEEKACPHLAHYLEANPHHLCRARTVTCPRERNCIRDARVAERGRELERGPQRLLR